MARQSPSALSSERSWYEARPWPTAESDGIWITILQLNDSAWFVAVCVRLIYFEGTRVFGREQFSHLYDCRTCRRITLKLSEPPPRGTEFRNEQTGCLKFSVVYLLELFGKFLLVRILISWVYYGT